MARVAKVETAAQMAGVDADELLDDIRTEIATHEIVAEETAGAPAEPVDPEVAAARQEALKAIIRKLHDGVPVEQVKAEFDALIVDVTRRRSPAWNSRSSPKGCLSKTCSASATCM